MAVTRKTLFCVVLVAAMLVGGCIDGAVHKVGESGGWSIKGVDYAAWASSQTFQVGDTLAFEYNKEYHDVTQVTLQDFQSCSVPSTALAKYQTGSDLVNLTKPGHYYFICGVPGHCQAGQKLDVLVTPSSLRPAPAPLATQPVLSPSISSPSSVPPPPPHNAASVSGAWSWMASSLLAFVFLASAFGF